MTKRLKWVVKELVNIYSSEKSFFSKKRIESGIAFVIAQWGMIYFMVENIDKMSSSDLFIWSGIEFAVSGYIINQIQKEKKSDDNPGG